MNWLNKLEKKFGRFAIPNLIVWLIGAYSIGYVLEMVHPEIMNYLNFQPHLILKGQIWRIVTWIFQPTSSGILSLLIMMVFYYQLGTALERTWGTFRFNAYLFGGMIFTVLGTLVLYGVIYLLFGPSVALMASGLMGDLVSTQYINMSIFLAFATLYPNMQVMLYFIIPIKMKWMAWVYAAIIVLDIISTFSNLYYGYGSLTLAVWITVIKAVTIIMSLLNFLIFFLSTRNLQRYTPHEIHRRQKFKQQMREPRPGSGITKHKCAVCGRTEVTNPELEFRFCSKCEGNYEYCQDHLFTHQHIRRV